MKSPRHVAGPQPEAPAAPPALIVTSEAADRIDALLVREDGRAAVVDAGTLHAIGVITVTAGDHGSPLTAQ